MIDPVHKAVIRAMEHFSPEATWQVPEDAQVIFGDRPGRPFDGMTITWWPEANR